MDEQGSDSENHPGLGWGLQMILVLATTLVAAERPFRCFFALLHPSRADEVGLAWLNALPTLTIVLGIIGVALESLLKIVVVWEVWKIAGRLYRGDIFSPTISSAIRRASLMLIGISVIDISTFAVGLASLWALRRPLPPLGVIAGTLNVPGGAFVCAILGFAIAAAFKRAAVLAEEARFTA